jgi:hypothetical protein
MVIIKVYGERRQQLGRVLVTKPRYFKVDSVVSIEN